MFNIMSKKFDKSIIAGMAGEGKTVAEMAQELQADFNELSKFYISCFAEDKHTFPLRLLATKSWLEEQLKKKTISQICQEIGTSFSVINRLVKIYDIKKKPLLKDVLTSEVLYSLFVEQHLSDREISKMYKCSIDTLKKLRAKYNINYESRNETLPVPSCEFFKRLYIEYGFSREQMIKLLGYNIFQFNKLLKQYGEIDSEIKSKRVFRAFENIIDLLLEKENNLVIYEQLKEHTLSQVAEMYDIIPAAEPGVETFTAEWLEIALHKMSFEQIIREYHIGRAYLNSIMKEANLKPIPMIDRLDVNTVKYLFIECGWDEDEIAKALHSSKYTVSELLKREGISKKDRKPLEAKLTLSVFHNLFVDENLTLAQIAKIFRVAKQQVEELKSKYDAKDPEISSHESTGATNERFNYLLKQFKYNTK